MRPDRLTRNEDYTEGSTMRIRIWMLALAPFALIGCADETPPVTTTTTTTTTQEVTTGAPTGAVVTREVVVPRAPPSVRIEAQTVAPGPGYIWTPGYWRWSGRDYVWVSGSWVRPPRTTAVWVPGHWVSRGAGWIWVPGHWR
jgi:WXXGXW repeat (2 copies)